MNTVSESEGSRKSTKSKDSKASFRSNASNRPAVSPSGQQSGNESLENLSIGQFAKRMEEQENQNGANQRGWQLTPLRDPTSEEERKGREAAAKAAAESARKKALAAAKRRKVALEKKAALEAKKVEKGTLALKNKAKALIKRKTKKALPLG